MHHSETIEHVAEDAEQLLVSDKAAERYPLAARVELLAGIKAFARAAALTEAAQSGDERPRRAS